MRGSAGLEERYDCGLVNYRGAVQLTMAFDEKARPACLVSASWLLHVLEVERINSWLLATSSTRKRGWFEPAVKDIYRENSL